jgi:hypothetical protein
MIFASTRRRARSHHWPSRLSAAALVGSLLVVSGCGHPATQGECEKIVERIARLEIMNSKTVPAGEVDSEISATKRAMQAQTLKQCVGKRITNRTLVCVDRATTSQQIIDECLR